MNIGMLGLGLMGQAMSGRLLEAGHTVFGHDIAPAAREAAAALGTLVFDAPGPVAEKVDTIFLSLPTSKERRDLLWGPAGCAASLAAGTLLLDTTTARPEDVEQDAARLLEQGVRLVDVCVSGSSQAVGHARALALVGDMEDTATYAPLLALFTKKAFFLGTPGQGNRAKLIVNLVFGLHRLVLAEALGLARRGGFAPETVLEILREGETYSGVMDTKGPKMLADQYEPPVARLAQHAKDVGLILEFAKSLNAPVPLSALHHEIITALVDAGHGHLDNAAIFKAYD